jgi:hypothetical protein
LSTSYAPTATQPLVSWDLGGEPTAAAAASPGGHATAGGYGGGYSGGAVESMGGGGTSYSKGGPRGTLRLMNDYQPYTVNDYKKRYEQGSEYWTMGKLGPDLDVHEINEKKAIKERIKERDRQVRVVGHSTRGYVAGDVARVFGPQRCYNDDIRSEVL